ncbi:MAG: phosphoribosylglycinamide formyltransferase [Eubacteriales bacterium]|nr:phosphoribosylglycinamide formyltransferase [Eubacteriales bacterium]
MTRIAVLVSGGGTNLQALLDAEAAGRLPDGHIALVISNKADAYALTRAERAGVPSLVIQAARGPAGQAEFEEKLQAALTENGIELIILAGFLRILTESFTSRWPKRILNVHPSLIPSFCGEGFYGLKVHQAALDYGVKVTGATVHFVNEIPDGGEIILQKAVYIEPNDTAETLQQRVMVEAEHKLLPQAAQLVSQKIREAKK